MTSTDGCRSSEWQSGSRSPKGSSCAPLRDRTWRALLVALCCVLLTACSHTPVLEDLSQQQATEVVALLSQHGITAVSRRVGGGRPSYTVEVKGSSYSQAIALIAATDVLDDRRTSFNQLTAQSGLIPNSREVEAVRADRALALEIEDLLRADPRILDARAVVRQHVLRRAERPAVSLVLQVNESNPPFEQVRELVANVVPGIEAEQIALQLVDAPDPTVLVSDEGVLRDGQRTIRVPLVPFLVWRVPDSDYNGLALTLVGFAVLAALVGALLGYWFGIYQQSRQFLTSALPNESDSDLLRLERGQGEE